MRSVFSAIFFLPMAQKFSIFIVLLIISICCFVLVFYLDYPIILQQISSIKRSNLSCFDFSTTTTTNNIDNDNDNHYSHYKLYRLFGTKTTYLTAREEIRKLFDKQWPLKQINKCSPVYLFFLNRHSIRYPSLKEIRGFRNILPLLRDKLITGGKLNSILFRELLNWKLLINDIDENRISQSGKLETAITGEDLLLY